MRLRHFLPLLAAALLSACVTNIKPSVTQNPPPAEALANFQHFKLMPLQASAAASENQDALQAIEGNLHAKLQPLAAAWESSSGNGRTLQIEPYIEEMKFVSTGKRLLGGYLAGSSAVVMRLRLTDTTTGRVIANPQFYQRASAMGAAYSFGGTDKAMLERIATVCEQYMQNNYRAAVGGPTGLEESK